MSDEAPKVQISIDDSYHRAKRAALAFSALLILAALATRTQHVSYSGFDIQMPIVRFTLWCAAFYHVGLFWFEYRAMIRLNSQFIVSDPTRSFSARLNEVERTVRENAVSINTAAETLARPSDFRVEHLVPELEGLNQVIEDARTQIGRSRQRLGPRHAGSEAMIDSEITQLLSIPEQLQTRAEQWSHSQAERMESHWKAQTNSMNQAQHAITGAADSIEQLIADMKQLADAVVSEQRFIVRAFDRGAVFGLFSLSTMAALAAPWLADRCLLPWNTLCLS